MSDQQLQPGYWRNASRLLNLYGIPAPLFLLYLAWFRFPSMVTIYVITAIIGGFRLLSFFGWTFKVLVMRLAYLCAASACPVGPGGIDALPKGGSDEPAIANGAHNGGERQ
ncbi:TraK protein [Pseudomonas amygdali pv. morsprunorum]|nr:TraK protein [Pseudomonas amygdali pv. morsprunorum]